MNDKGTKWGGVITGAAITRLLALSERGAVREPARYTGTPAGCRQGRGVRGFDATPVGICPAGGYVPGHEHTGWIRSRTAPQRRVERARIVLGSAGGMSGYELSIVMGISHPTIQRWLDRYEEFGVEGLDDQPRSDRPKALARATPRLPGGSGIPIFRKVFSGAAPRSPASCLVPAVNLHLARCRTLTSACR